MDCNLDMFRENSFCLMKDVLRKETLSTIREFLEGECEKNLDYLQKLFAVETVESLVDKVNTPSFCQDGFTDEQIKLITGHFSRETRLDPKILEILQPNFLGIIKQLLNSQKIYMHMPPVARFIVPYNKRSMVPAHQDISYNRHMTNFIVTWIPLVDIDEECAGVYFYKGKIKSELLKNKNQEGIWFEPLEVQHMEKIHFKMNVGDILIFDPYVIHASAPNVSNRIRYSVDMRFFSESEESTKPFLDIETGNRIFPKRVELYDE